MKICTLFTFLILSINCLFSQNIINDYSYSFDDETLDDWQSQTILSGGIWNWKQNGKADNGTYWNDRDSIHSESLGGAVVYDADKISGPNNPGSTNSGALVSPDLDFTGELTVFLKFYQYYRNFESTTKIEYTLDGIDWIPINTTINEFVAKNVETGAKDYQIIDISSEVGGSQNVRIRFVFEGDYYFWILDDIEFYNAMPFPQTNPEYVGDSLVNFGYPFEIEESDWPHARDELVVQFKLGTPEPIKQELRDTLGASLIDSCTCGRLELWRLGDNIIVDGDTLSSFGGSIGVQERIKKSTASSSIDGVDYNKYNYNQLQDGVPVVNAPLPQRPDNIPVTPADVTKVAILDTGIDLDHEILENFIFRNEEEGTVADQNDDDGNCLVDDWVGWNYVDGNNNPNDDHSHGTHVAGIIWQTLQDSGSPDCEYRIIPYKTHDYHGFATLFNVACATYQAQEDEVDVINDSWGFYGNPSIILNNAMDTARINEVLIVSAAGNDTTDLSSQPQYPACYGGSNILTVGSYGRLIGPNGEVDTLLSGFSNYDPGCVDILAPGDSIYSTVPLFINTTGFDYKSGTSMSAPAVTAAAVKAYCDGHTSFLEVKENILNCADKYVEFDDVVRDGNVLNLDFPCIVPVEEVGSLVKPDFLLYPNPVSAMIYIENAEQLENARITLYTATGQLIFEKQMQHWNIGDRQVFNILDQPAGIYFLTINHGQEIWSQKLIKM